MVRLLGKDHHKVLKKVDAAMESLVKGLMGNNYSGNELLGCIVRSASLYISLETLRKMVRVKRRRR